MAISRNKRILFSIIIIVILMTLAEVIARLVPGTKQVVPAGISRFDPLLGWSLKPASHASGWVGDHKVDYRINSKGLRDNEIEYKKPPGTYRIVVVGDSNTFGFGVPIEKHFTYLLEGYFRQVDVINMGVNAYGIDQELLFLRIEGFRYEPDLVMAYIPHYGDHRHMHSNRFGMNKPLFIRNDGKLVLTNSPVTDDIEIATSKSIVRKIHWWLVRRSQVYKIIRNGAIYMKNRGAHLSQSNNEFNKKPIINTADTKQDVFVRELNALGEELVYEMHKESALHKAEFVLVTMIDKLHEEAIRHNINSLHVAAPLHNKKYDLPGNLAHINESGNGVLSYEIARYLIENSLIPQNHLLKR
ncbi:hypothetical protein C4544_04300 [candidate division WS5 bacterium]|uniref:SGNH/GDSL hydrolase family protein n=1 Tax=candidate division WS5 bacterium TaxID=2093353 RepID=A0A419DCP5_9BACT|nr:MAG: hypothetical protein C4544_04300 [candidate division WS5 bacterium]